MAGARARVVGGRAGAGTRSLVVVALVVGALVALAGPAAAAPGGPAVRRYVALGDSYTAGPLIPPATGRPAGCLRSGRNYPALVAEALGVATLVDVSCSGAETADLTAPQGLPLGARNPAQLGALTGAEDLVTLGIGGNDIGFSTIVVECARISAAHPLGAACRERYTAGGRDELRERIAATAGPVAAALRTIAGRSPRARVALVGYPALLPDTGPGCYPVVPYSPGDVAYLRGVEKALNAMLAAQAAEAGVRYVDTYSPSIGHDMCQETGVRWVEGLIPGAAAAPVHPNALGMQGMAAAVLGAVGQRSRF